MSTCYDISQATELSEKAFYTRRKTMGYSCTKKADDTLVRIGKTFATDGNPNILTIGAGRFFFEHGQEQSDGAITGSLMEIVGDFCRKVGSVRISPEGQIVRFPALKKNQKTSLNIQAAGYDYDHHGDVVYLNVSVEQAAAL